MTAIAVLAVFAKLAVAAVVLGIGVCRVSWLLLDVRELASTCADC